MKINIKFILKSIYAFLMDNFHQSQNLEYRLLKRSYVLYRHEVLKQNKTFELYIRDYLSEIHNFQYKTPKELSEKSRIHTRVSDIFTLRPDLIKQYFDKTNFVFIDYKILIKEYNTTLIDIEQEEPQPQSIVEQEQPVLDDNNV
ncbi:MAG: hypothetical protein ACK5KT_13715 [Dysgonomonas sp.]